MLETCALPTDDPGEAVERLGGWRRLAFEL